MHIPAVVVTVVDKAIAFVYSFQPICEKTVVLVPDKLTEHVASLSATIGMDVETVTYVLGLFLCYPLGLIMLNIPFGTPRHIFSFLLGAFLLQFTLGVQWIHQLISSLVAYAMIVTLPRKTLKTALPFFAMVYLTLGHLHRQYVNYLGWDLDFTGAQMVLTMKLYMIGFNLYDGEVISKGIDDRAAKKCAAYALLDSPSLIEFLGYTFCFSNLLAGPASEFAIYKRSVTGSVFDVPGGKIKPGKKPSNVMPTLVPLVTSLVCMGLFVTLTGSFPLLDPKDPQRNTPVVISDGFLKKSIWYRYAYLWIGLLGVRQKYYFGWKNAEGATNIWYGGFDGFDENGEPKGWETSNNINILGFETAPDVQTLSKEWNKKTSFWLTKYVYIRTGGSLMAVYAMSAFWHGFYPGYYCFFLSVPLLTFCDRLAKKKLSPYFSKSVLSPYGIASCVATSISANYMVSSFVMLAFSWSWDLWKSLYFFGHIAALGFFGILNVLPKPKADKLKSKTA